LYGNKDVDVDDDEGRNNKDDEDDDEVSGIFCKCCRLCPPLGSIITPGNIHFWKSPIVLRTVRSLSL
jgi:hypothetical protein